MRAGNDATAPTTFKKVTGTVMTVAIGRRLAAPTQEDSAAKMDRRGDNDTDQPRRRPARGVSAQIRVSTGNVLVTLKISVTG